MAAGRTELEGTVRERDGTVDPPYVGDPCVHVDWEAERRERHRDEDGNVHYTWETVASGSETLAFDLEDDTGRARIRADVENPTIDINADSHRQRETYHTGEHPPTEVREFVSGGAVEAADAQDDGDDDSFLEDAVDAVGDALDGHEPLMDTNHRRRYDQQVLPVGSNVYVFGEAETRDGASMDAGQQDLLEIRRHDGTDEFLISDSDEEDLQESYSRRGPAAIVAGLAVSAASLYFLLSMFILPAL